LRALEELRLTRVAELTSVIEPSPASLCSF
jgi:hypothetical protein